MKTLAQIYSIANQGEHIGNTLATRAIRRIERELKLFEIPPHIEYSKEIIDDLVLRYSKVHIGCERNILDSFLNIDICKPCDLMWDVRTGLPSPDNFLDLIVSEHFLEHIDYGHSARVLIKDCFRTLKNGGKLIIGVPDAESILQAYASDNPNYFENIRRHCYSKRDKEIYPTKLDLVCLLFHDEFSHEKYHPHLWAYDLDNLSNLIISCGFKYAEKISSANEYMLSTNRPETLFVLATK